MNGYISTDIETLDFIKNYNKSENDKQIKFTSIIMLTYNKLEYTKLCVESIRKFTKVGFYEIIIVDNNSTDETVKWLKNQSDIKVIFNKCNKGFPIGCNQGIEVSKGESILLLNNDTIVTPNWLENLNEALYSNINIGAVGAITNNCSNSQQIPVTYTNISEMIDFSIGINKSNKEYWDYKTKLVGFCYLIKKEVLEKVGVLDPIFTPGNYEDDDISLRILKSGYNLLLCRDTFIHHFGSVSFIEEESLYSLCLSRNSLKFNNKYGIDRNSNIYPNYELIEMINKNKSEAIKVLQVGCGVGGTLLQVKNNFRACEVYGVESNEKLVKIASGVIPVKVGNIETMDINYKEDFFDYIIIDDMIEHLNDPWSVLKKLCKYLKPRGSLITIIPNVNHITVVKDLINGKFPYVNAGLLDKTHLRFFTLEEMKKLFNETGYEISYVKNVTIPITEKDEFLINELCKLSNENMRNEYKTYTYNLKVIKKIDLKRYEEEKLILLKDMLMKLDNNINNDETFNYIFKMYNEEKLYFGYDIRHIIKNNIINKEIVLSKIINEAIYRDYKDIVEVIGGVF